MQKITLIGHIGRNAAAERHSNEGNTAFLSFSLGDNSRVKGVDKATWYDVIWFNYRKGIVEYLKPGTNLVVVGDLDLDFENKRATVIADSVTFNRVGGRENTNEQTDSAQVQQKAAAPAPTARPIEQTVAQPVVTGIPTPPPAMAAPVQAAPAQAWSQNSMGDADDLPF